MPHEPHELLGITKTTVRYCTECRVLTVWCAAGAPNEGAYDWVCGACGDEGADDA